MRRFLRVVRSRHLVNSSSLVGFGSVFSLIIKHSNTLRQEDSGVNPDELFFVLLTASIGTIGSLFAFTNTCFTAAYLASQDDDAEVPESISKLVSCTWLFTLAHVACGMSASQDLEFSRAEERLVLISNLLAAFMQLIYHCLYKGECEVLSRHYYQRFREPWLVEGEDVPPVALQHHADVHLMIEPSPRIVEGVDVDTIPSDEIPDAFICAISQSLMLDPVMTADGQNYERSEILEWFRLGKRTSPLTGAPLIHTNICTDFKLRARIVDWLKAYQQPAPVPAQRSTALVPG